MDCKAELIFERHYPPVINHDSEVAHVERVANLLLGNHCTVSQEQITQDANQIADFEVYDVCEL